MEERIKVLCGGSSDKARLTEVANQLKDEGYRISGILKGIKQETGVGLSLRTVFNRPESAERGLKLESRTAKVVKKRIEDEIVEEARNKIQQVLSVGKAVVDRMAPIARLHGYTDVEEFIWRTYNFWDLHHDQISRFQEDKRNLDRAIKALERRFGQEAKKILLHNAMKEQLLAFTMISCSAGKFPPPYYYFDIRKVLASVLYDDLIEEIESERDHMRDLEMENGKHAGLA